MHEKIEINTDYITLGQFIKLINILESGGMVKAFLQDQGALVNGELDHRRGRKLYPDDVVEIESIGSYIVTKD
ncbi:S4 domain protein YaaA [Virgibacillus subterraneus]|uniref:S4 domain protein YaaA n=2 Tax=Virgibacillus TaxID=84406 RepID=A0A1H0XPI2_9BACI|nr:MULTISPECIES: S4 domain-containing protein YaaA [Virgibacillus]SDQ04721.1 S4 domain protein YaaA [Virgibacillus salinus]SEP58340.1 S4 domain protein YaaA [Virgibacillus subterraneus]